MKDGEQGKLTIGLRRGDGLRNFRVGGMGGENASFSTTRLRHLGPALAGPQVPAILLRPFSASSPGVPPGARGR